MQFISQRFVSQKFEFQFQKYLRSFRLRFQLIQKIILLPLIVYYTIEKVFEASWFVVSLNIGLGIIIGFSLKYQKKCLYIYEILMLFAILLFNAFYAASQYLNIHPERYKFIDGYFLAILSLAIINMMDTIYKVIILTSIYVVFLLLIPNPMEPTWQQTIKFIIYIILYCQQQRYQQKLLRMTYLQYSKHLTIENSIKDNMEMKYYVVNFQESTRSIILQQEKYSDYTIEEEQYEFYKFLRNVHVTNCTTKIKKQIRIQKRHSAMNLEQFLFYLFTDKKKLKELENYDNKYLDHQHQLFGYTEDETYSIKVIKCFDKDPCAILIVTEHQKEQFVNKLKLQNKAQIKMLNYFSDIFQTKVRVSLVILTWLLNNKELVKNNFVTYEQYLKYSISRLYISMNSFYNIQDYYSVNSDNQRISIQKFDLLKIAKETFSNVVFYKKLNKIHTCFVDIKTNLSNLPMSSDIKQIKQLFLNLMLFSMKYSKQITVDIEEDFDISDPPVPLIKVQFILQCFKGVRIDINQFPIINPKTLEELKLNDKKELNLNISISLLIIRTLGPFNNITIKHVGKSQYRIQFYLYKDMNPSACLMTVHSFDPKQYIKRSDDWQLTQSALKNQSLILFNSSPEIRIDTQRCIKSLLPLPEK